MNEIARKTHLEYYREHQITPVRYDLTSIDAHLDRRYSLYAKLGLLPLTFSNASVLEVAAGTGHNSLYIAQCRPVKLVLLEPNQSGLNHIHEVYNAFDREHTKPIIIDEMLEDYNPTVRFDIVLCENWLGTSQHEQALLKKLAGFVEKQGIMVLTTVSPIGFVPNLLRRFLSVHLAHPSESFEKRTETLVSAFSSHLDTLESMTRSNIDWVQDNMINPAYFGLCLSIPRLLELIGGEFSVIGTSPSFAEDWRWFKSLTGKSKNFNKQLLDQYYSKAHNFLDYRSAITSNDYKINQKLEDSAIELMESIAKYEDLFLGNNNPTQHLDRILSCLDDFISALPESQVRAISGLKEVKKLVESTEAIRLESVSSMKEFSSLFGRETVYVSLLRDSYE